MVMFSEGKTTATARRSFHTLIRVKFNGKVKDQSKRRYMINRKRLVKLFTLLPRKEAKPESTKHFGGLRPGA